MGKVTILLMLILSVSGCDTFFMVDALIIDDATREPLPSAKATLVLDKGVGELDIIKLSSDDGYVSFVMNEPRNAWATLTVEKEGYNTWSAQFRGAPRNPIAVRLMSCEGEILLKKE